MITKYSMGKRITSVFLALTIMFAMIPITALTANAAGSTKSVTGVVTDPNTSTNWETMMGTDNDGNRYAGRVWVDRSVYKDGDTVVLNSRGEAGSSFQVALEDDETFQVIFSALGSSMTTTETTSTAGPMDVVLILDNSDSMKDSSRMSETIAAANKLLASLLENNDVRVGVTTYSQDAATVLPFGKYDNGVELKYDRSGVVKAYDNSEQLINGNYKSDGYNMYTNTQSGFEAGMEMLATATDTNGRKPVAILLTDGAANTALDTLFWANRTGTIRQVYYGSNISPMIALSTLLSAAYNKAVVANHYGIAPMVYGIGVDLSDTDGSNAIINPKANFNNNNRNSNIQSAYELFTQTWSVGRDVSGTSGNYTFRFGHVYPVGSGINDNNIKENINYVDTYYSASSAELESVFDQIYEELSSGAFNPISTTTKVEGGTGEEHTPLIYVDYIGQYMEIKEIQGITLFGASYGVTMKPDGSYVVTEQTGINPATGEVWNTAEDILVSVTEEADGTQKLEIKINQEILPIIMEQVASQTIGNVTTSTITELQQSPLRVYYTIGLDSDILLPNGKVDVSKIQNYAHLDDNSGTVSFYSSQFGEINEANNSGEVIKGDSHVGFKPSKENRFYYHQTNQGIFTEIRNKSDNSVVTIPENEEYGILWDEDKYSLTWMTYEDYLAIDDYDKIYTYVTYYRPTLDNTDASTAAEEVSYLVYTEWLYLKESIAFYDAESQTYLNDGKAITAADVQATIAAYMQSNPDAEIYAVLGVGSRRTSRLHNMTVDKDDNFTSTSEESYSPEYMDYTAAHNGNDVVVWLGNNGKLTVEIETGIALTKVVTEAIGDDTDTYLLTVTVPAGVTAAPEVVTADGSTVSFTYINNVLTVNVKAGQTVYISGIPGGTECEIGEQIKGDYYIADKTDKVTVPKVSDALSGTPQFVSAVVTNAPHKYGNLFITKEITGDHFIPDSILDREFDITVNVGISLTGKTFTISDSAATATYTRTVDAHGNMTFTIKANQTIEILNLPEGTKAVVTESDPGANFAVSYRTRNHSGEAADNDSEVVIPAGGNATTVILNRYTPTSTTVDLDISGTKKFSIEGTHSGGSFDFKVQKRDGAKWVDISGKTASVSYQENEHGVKTFTIENVLAGIEYTHVGSWVYQVLEVKGNVENVTYDRTLYSFSVTVTDNGGQLVATVTDVNNTEITDGSYRVEFVNTYNTAPISMDIVKEVNNKSGDDTVSKAGFKFRSKAVDKDGNALDPNAPETSTSTIYTDAAGNARISGYYSESGTYYYIIWEDASENIPGWEYSKAEYFVTVVVTVDNGNLSSKMTIIPWNDAAKAEKAPFVTNDNEGHLYFTNTYDPADIVVNLDGSVVKELTGKTLKAGMFSFYVFEDGKVDRKDYTKALFGGTNNLNGDVKFVDFEKELTYDKVGTYAYDIVEFIPDGATLNAATGMYELNGMRYDPTIYDLIVEVKLNATSGKLEAVWLFEDSTGQVATFHNKYEATPTTYKFGGQKTLDGRAMQTGEFSFGLYEGNTLKETVNNKADGSFTFSAIEYTKAGTYTYTIKEIEPATKAPGVIYDGVNHPITVTVTVTDTDGELSASADVSNADIKFNNTYTASSVFVNFEAHKTLKGKGLLGDTFFFELYATDYNFTIADNATPIVRTSCDEEGVAGFGYREFMKPGTYFFAIIEDATNPIEEIVYDTVQHNYIVTVRDQGIGKLEATVLKVGSTSSVFGYGNVSAVVANFENATFDEVVEKEVYAQNAPQTNIDGKKVNEGEILTYFIKYTNYTGAAVVADITDTIPNYTSYVEGSASHNGTYAETHINWILNVADGETVTVSFNVRVDETQVIVTNTAVVRDGVNTYITNEVVNHTVEDQLEKDVFSLDDVTVSIDGNKVYSGDELLYKVTFTNAGMDAVDIKITDKLPTNTTYIADSADNGGVYVNGEIVWDLNVPAWQTVTVSFKVKVNTGIGAVIIENKATATDGTNNYETNIVTNYTVEDEVGKKVFAADNAEVNIDGNTVARGDTLNYAISYKNTSLDKVTVVIKDTVPMHTTYVTDSADNGGVYKDGELTWILEVEAGATVTVSFKVKVESAESATVKNKATVTEGKNTYTTNEVSNPIKNEVPGTSDDPKVPQTGDNTHLAMWVVLMFISGGAALTLGVYGKKKSRQL